MLPASAGIKTSVLIPRKSKFFPCQLGTSLPSKLSFCPSRWKSRSALPIVQLLSHRSRPCPASASRILPVCVTPPVLLSLSEKLDCGTWARLSPSNDEPALIINCSESTASLPVYQAFRSISGRISSATLLIAANTLLATGPPEVCPTSPCRRLSSGTDESAKVAFEADAAADSG